MSGTASYFPVVTPSFVLQRLSEDEAQALDHFTAILGLNQEPAIEPGQLQGMSMMLENAKRTWEQMRKDSWGQVEEQEGLGELHFQPRPIFL